MKHKAQLEHRRTLLPTVCDGFELGVNKNDTKKHLVQYSVFHFAWPMLSMVGKLKRDVLLLPLLLWLSCIQTSLCHLLVLHTSHLISALCDSVLGI